MQSFQSAFWFCLTIHAFRVDCIRFLCVPKLFQLPRPCLVELSHLEADTLISHELVHLQWVITEITCLKMTFEDKPYLIKVDYKHKSVLFYVSHTNTVHASMHILPKSKKQLCELFLNAISFSENPDIYSTLYLQGSMPCLMMTIINNLPG